MEKIIGIYKITSPSGKIYIGQSRDINSRKSDHKHNWSKRQYKLYSSINKYGWDAHSFDIIHECTIDELDNLESFYIKYYDCFDTEHGLNLTSGGVHNLKYSTQSKLKLSESKKGISPSPETRIKLSNAIKGIKRTPETIEKMRISKIGKIHSNQSKKLISETKGGTYDIYDNENKLISHIHGNIKNELKRLKLPEHKFCDSYKQNAKITKGKYIGWYVIKY